MKVKLIIISIILLLVIVFASGCIPVMEKLGLVSPTNEEQLSPGKGGPPDGLVKVLIGFKEKPGAAQQAVVRSVGGKIKYTYHIVDAIAASIPEKAIVALQNNPNVRYVEPDGIVQALDELDNSWGVKRIGAGVVHDSGNKGAGVKVAIIDTGIDYTHPDLDANYAGGYDFVNGDNDPMDDNGHGTHVAGTVAAEDNDEGVVGVAPEAALYALKMLDETGRGYVSDIVAAIEWAVDPPEPYDSMDIINMSLGGGASTPLEEVCQSAYDKGLLLVAAAGNSGNPPGRGDNIIYPARYESVIAVAATDQNDKRARWSSTGSDLELSAPGVAINSTLLGGGYGEKNGTSMASPHVAGTAALVIAAGIPDVRTQLQDTADNLGDSSLYGYGLVDADEAAGVGTPPPDTGTIAGNVADASTSLTIEKARVVVEGTDLFAITGADGNYTIIDVPVETYTVTASAAGYESASQIDVAVSANTITPNVNFSLTLSANGTTIHIESIDISFKETTAGPNTFYTAVATVTVFDSDGNPVEGATVYGHWSDATTDTDSGVTDSNGQVSLKSDKVKNPESVPTFTFTVDDVSKDGWTYVPNENTETSDSKTYN